MIIRWGRAGVDTVHAGTWPVKAVMSRKMVKIPGIFPDNRAIFQTGTHRRLHPPPSMYAGGVDAVLSLSLPDTARNCLPARASTRVDKFSPNPDIYV